MAILDTKPLSLGGRINNTSGSVFGSKQDLTTLQGFEDYARSLGIEPDKPFTEDLMDRIRGVGRGLLGGIGTLARVLQTGEFAVGGILAGEGPIEGIKKQISPSDIIFDDWQPRGLGGEVAKFVSSLALDIAIDPITYLTLGVGSAIKFTTKAGKIVAVSKPAIRLTKELAEEIGEKEARRQVAQLALAESGDIVSRGGLKAITRALESVGKEITAKNVREVIESGVKELRAAGGGKFMGKEILSPA